MSLRVGLVALALAAPAGAAPREPGPGAHAAAPPAARSGAAPLDLGPGGGPAVAVDAAGTAHIAWTVRGGEMYCRLARRATACDVRQFLALRNIFGPVAILRRADGTLLIIQDTRDSGIEGPYGTTWVRVSADGGATWRGPSAVATGAFGHTATALSADGQGVVTLAPTAGGVIFQQAPLAGEQPRTLNLGDLGPGAARLAVLADGRMIAAGTQSARVFGGGDPYDAGAWSAPRAVAGPELATGPRGTFLLAQRTLAQQTRDDLAPFALLPFTGSWGKARQFGADALVGGGGAAMIEDGGGRVHVVAATGGCLLYTRTGPRKRGFGRTTTLARLTGAPAAPRAGAAPDGRGVAVWAAAGHVFVAKLHQRSGAYAPIGKGAKRPACP